MTESSFPEQVFVLHVAEGYEHRARHMERMLACHGIGFEYVLEGDMATITPGIISDNFAGELACVSAPTSCAFKHLTAYRRIVERGLPGAFIMEDDIELVRGFSRMALDMIGELRRRCIDNAIVSLEESNLMYVPGSRRRKGVMLYEGERDRFAGCYYITRECAAAILGYVRAHRCHLPIDLFHTFLVREGVISYYWMHPTIACQATSTGRDVSSTSGDKALKRMHYRLTWHFKRFYKRLLYRLR